jgi:(R,R)-butanediol dehydrogenase / meso-butanediol dehydrogenase / diacetyl reductase
MRAVVFSSAGGLAVASVPEPVPAAGEIVVRVLACGICGSDLHLHERKLLPDGSIMGHEFCGEVAEAAHGFRSGERVCALPALSCGGCQRCRSGLGAYCAKQRSLGLGLAPGAFAEYVSVAAHETLRLPDAVGDEAGALVEPLAVALHAVRVGRLRRGEGCLILGGGPIGLGALLWARYFDAGPVVLTERAPARVKLAQELGATEVAAPEALDAAVARHFPGGPPLVIEAVGAPGLIQCSLSAVGFRGRVVVAGVCFGKDELEPIPALLREASVQFVFAYEKDDFQYTIDALARERIAPLPMITSRCTLDEVPAAFAALTHAPPHGKVMYRSVR